MATDKVLIRKEDGVMQIVLNKPEKRNALDQDMCKALTEAFEDAAEDRSVRALALRGEGNCFCAGIDFSMLAEIGAKSPSAPEFRFFLVKIQRVFNTMEQVEKPIIALIHKYCYGMGTEMALAADFRIATENSGIGIQEVELGLIPDVGGTTRLTRMVGIPMAKEMIMTARVLSAKEAYDIRLVNEVVPEGGLDEALGRWTTRLKGCAPLAVGAAKKLIDCGNHLDRMTFMELEGILQTTLLTTKDVQEGIAARMQKRKPDFKGK